jgi:predicted MFS family arabinose efflux permease
VNGGSLWGHPDFLRLWIGQTISEFGTVVTRTAVPLVAILVLNASAGEVGALIAFQSAGVLVVGLVAGAVVDRVRRRPVLILADLLRAALLLWVPFSFAVGTLRIEQLFLLVFVVAALSAFFDSAYRAYLPGLVGPERTLEGNSKLGFSESLAEVAAPGAAGALIQVVSAPFTLLVDAVSYVASAVSLLTIAAPESSRPPRRSEARLAGDISEGLATVARHPILRALAGSTVLRHFFGSFLGALYGLYAIRELGMSPLVLGLLVSSGGVGAVAGALLTQPLVARLGIGPMLIGTAIAEAIVVFLIPLAAGPVLVASAFLFTAQLVGDALLQAHYIVHTTVRQQVTPDRLLGRVSATVNVLEHGVAPLGALVAALLAETFGVRATLFVAAWGILLATSWLVFSPLRSLREVASQSIEG